MAGQREQPERRKHGRQGQEQRDPRGYERPEGDDEDDQRDREREQPGLREVVGEDLVGPVDRAREAELADEQPGVRFLHLVHPVEHRADLVCGEVGVAADLELDEGRVAVRRDLARVGRVERRTHVLHDVETGDAGDDVGDRGLEGGIGRTKRRALDQDALACGLLEPGVEDPVHAAGLAGPGGVGVDALRSDGASDAEGDDDEREPAERGGLPVAGAPATHAGREVVMGVVGARHAGCSLLVDDWCRRYEGAGAQSSSLSRIRALTKRRFPAPTSV